MRIAIDLRSLQSGSISGVENYTLNLLDALLAMDKKNTYTLFYNSLKEGRMGEFQFINSKTVKTRFPNRLLNLALMLKAVRLEKIIGEFDALFMPNLNQFNISPSAKLAITVHDLSPVVTPEFYDAKRQLWHKLLGFRRSFERANVIFAVSEYTKKDLVGLFGLPEHKIKVAYPGIDRSSFHSGLEQSKLRAARNKFALPGEYILFLNTIEPRKNLSGLIKAFEKLDHSAYLVIAGRKGWKHRRIFSEIKNSKKSDRIKYIGYISEQDKPAVMKLSKALVYPSFYEGFGFQPLEAQALGVPAVVSQVTALPEVAGDASLLINPYNTDDLSAALKTVLTDNQLRAQLISKGFAQAAKFDWNKTAEKVLEGLNNL